MPASNEPISKPPRRKRIWRVLRLLSLCLIVALIGGRIALPYALRWYVIQTINRNALYNGHIADINVHLWRGAYTITELRLVKTTGNIPVPLFSAKRVDLALEWESLLSGKAVGKMTIDEPELNFVDASDPADAQTGAEATWLQIIKDLYPFRINSAQIRKGSVHLRAFNTDPPVDVYLSYLDGSIRNLSNIRDETAPLIATADATALAMDQAKFEYHMKLDPFSYRPTYQLAVRLLGLDATKANALARAYGGFDFEGGWFDLIVELNVLEGSVDGYIKPLFRNIEIFNLAKDARKDDPLQLFWEAIVGTTTGVLQNQPRHQFATVIPVQGDQGSPHGDLFVTVGNVLRNAFIRAYLPRFEGGAPDIDQLRFKPGSVSDATSPLDD